MINYNISQLILLSPFDLIRWLITKHPKPLKEEVVCFMPYNDSVDPTRGTTVLPYLEAAYNYYGGSVQQDMLGDRQDDQDEALFDPGRTQENAQ